MPSALRLAAALLGPSVLPALADPESRNPIRDLGSELREHSDSVALRVRDALDHSVREWKIQCCHSLEEKERQLRSSGRSDEADVARRQGERFELPKARLALVKREFVNGKPLRLIAMNSMLALLYADVNHSQTR
jgi:hypothetical protein